MAIKPFKSIQFPGLPDTYTIPQIDSSLNTEGMAADAKAVGDAIGQLSADLGDLEDRVEDLEEGGSGGGSGVPTSVKSAMLALFQAGTYTGDVSSYIATISSWASEISGISVSPTTASISGSSTTQLVATTTPAGGTVTWESSNTAVATVSSSGLVTGIGNGTATITARCGSYHASCAVTVSGFATLTGISAVYTQSGTVYEDTSLNSLKNDLVVTAHYDNSTTATVTDYTLSGSLSVGTSTIVVAYGGKTTTFDVTVTWSEVPSSYTKKGYIYRTSGEGGWIDGLPKLIKTNTITNVTDLTYEFDVMPMAAIRSAKQIIGAKEYGLSGSNMPGGTVFYLDTERKRVSVYSHSTAIGVNDIETVVVGQKTTVKLVPGTESPAVLYINGALGAQGDWTSTISGTAPIGLHTYIGENGRGAEKTFASANIAVGTISLYDSSDNLVAKYIPCVRTADNVIGLYDSVGRVFYTAETVSYATIGDSSCVYAVGDWEE